MVNTSPTEGSSSNGATGSVLVVLSCLCGFKYDSASNVYCAAWSMFAGCFCLTEKLTCGLSSCERKWFRANTSWASDARSG